MKDCDCCTDGVRDEAAPSCMFRRKDFDAATDVIVERCDECQQYPDDMTAAQSIYNECRIIYCINTGSAHVAATRASRKAHDATATK